MDIPHVPVPVLPLTVEVLQKLCPLAAPPLLTVLQPPQQVQRGAVTLSQEAPVLLPLVGECYPRIGVSTGSYLG